MSAVTIAKYLALCFVALLYCPVLRAQSQWQCYGVAKPAGWVTTNRQNMASCPQDPLNPLLANAIEITRYDNLPVGAVLSTCNEAAPAGWSSSASVYHPSICDCEWANCIPFSPNVTTLTHVTCAPPQSGASCYPPGPTGAISASPTTVTVPYGQNYGKTYVTWSTANTASACVWVSNSAATPSLWACGTSGSNQLWPYVPKGSTSKFILTTSSTSSSPALATKTVTGVAGAQPTMYASPASVVVPWGAVSANTVLHWNAPGYGTLDWCGKVNNGAWQFAGLATDPSGTTTVPMTPGTTYGYRLYAQGTAAQCGTTGLLASASVSATQGAQPTFTMTPTHVIVPLGSTTGPFTYSWNAPGYTNLDLWGKVNNGPWQFALTVPATSSTGDNIAVGNTYYFRFYPVGNSTAPVGELSVTASR